MNPRDQGFLLLTGQLGDPNRKPLTVAQFRTLAQRVQQMDRPRQERSLEIEDLVAMGYDLLTAEHILTLLSQQALLEQYLERGVKQDIYPITRTDPAYPPLLRQRLGLDSPASLWAKGSAALLNTPSISLVGSRELLPQNEAFAWEVGKQAALQGFTLVSGNARGADLTAQKSCLAYGGRVISVVADRLDKCPWRKNVLYLCEDGYDLPFSAQRALSRNRIIHCLSLGVFVAQVRLRKGGTWSGASRNLGKGWSPVFCCNDNSPGFQELVQMGAASVTKSSLADISGLTSKYYGFY